MKRILLTVILSLLATLLFSGCTSTKIETADGTKFSSIRFADWTKIGKLDADLSAGKVNLEGYDGDRQTATVELSRAVAALAGSLVKP